MSKRANTRDLSIIVIDDDADSRGVLNELLGEAGYCVSAYADAESAIAEFEPGTVRCAIIAVIMADLDGIDVAVRLRRKDPTLRWIGLYDSGRPIPQSVAFQAATAFGANGMLNKPVSRNVVMRLLRAAISGK